MFVLLKDTNKNLDGYVIQEYDDYDLVLHKPSRREYKKLILKGVISSKHDDDNFSDLIMFSITNFQHENKDFTKYIVEYYKKVLNDCDIDRFSMYQYLQILIVYFVFYKKPVNADLINCLLSLKDNSVGTIRTLIVKIIKYNELFKTNTNAKEIFFNHFEYRIKKLKNVMVKLERYNLDTKYEVDTKIRYWNGVQNYILYKFNGY